MNMCQIVVTSPNYLLANGQARGHVINKTSLSAMGKTCTTAIDNQLAINI